MCCNPWCCKESDMIVRANPNLIGTRTPHTISSLHGLVCMLIRLHIFHVSRSVYCVVKPPLCLHRHGCWLCVLIAFSTKTYPLLACRAISTLLFLESMCHFTFCVYPMPSFRAWCTVGVKIAKNWARWCPKSEK